MTAPKNAIALARKFHEAYERLAPSFGYATREDTKEFRPDTPNGRLMTAVCAELLPRLAPAGSRSGEDARDAARYRRFRSATMDERRRFEHYSDTALDVVLDAATGGNDA